MNPFTVATFVMPGTSKGKVSFDTRKEAIKHINSTPNKTFIQRLHRNYIIHVTK